MIKLTDEQNNAKDKIIDHLNEVKNGDIFSENSFISLAGAAGTGKTTLVKYIVQELLKNGWKICITSPTHQAVKVIKNTININNRNLKYASLHSFLALKPGEINPETGERKFKRETDKRKKSPISLEHFDIVINDESSMISHNMFKFIKEEMYSNHRVKSFLFIGDLYQLGPVDDSNLHNLHAIYDNDKINHYSLTKVLRQKDMETIDFVGTIRNMIKQRNTKYELFNWLVNERDKKVHNKIHFYNTKKEFITTFIKEDRLGKDDDCIATFTNKNVNIYNEKIRNYYTKMPDGTVPDIHPLDLFVIQESTQEDFNYGQNSFINSEIVKLKESHYTDFDFKGKIFKGYKCITEDNRQFNMLHKSSKDDYENACELLRLNAIKTKNRMNWKMYYELLGIFIKVRPQFASTVHKLQGSSYRHIWVDLSDLGYLDDETLLRLFYVATTRSKNEIHILI